MDQQIEDGMKKLELDADTEILEFLGKMIHSFGHLVVALQSELRVLSYDLNSEKAVNRIHRATNLSDEMAAWLHRVRFLLAEDNLIACDFMRDIFEPVIMSGGGTDRGRRMSVAASARNAPLVLIRPRLASWGLMRLAEFLYASFRCAGHQSGERFTFFITYERSVSGLIQKEQAMRGCEFLRAAGALVQMRPIKKELSITLKIAKSI
jgi:hypothetical protein